MATRWGIVGAGKISNDFVTALQISPEHHQVIAVASQDRTKAEEFAARLSISHAYGSYHELSGSPDIDVVYIGNLNPDHFPTAKLMLEAGKHVLCEKPMCISLEETEKLIEIAQSNKKFLMEALWSRFFPAYFHLRDSLDNGVIGQPTTVEVSFGFQLQGAERVVKKALGGGVTYDMGIYPIHLASLVFKGAKPKRIVATGHLNSEGTDDKVIVALDYGEGKMASLIYSSDCSMHNSAVIAGKNQFIRILPSFHAPTELQTPTGILEFPLPENNGKFCYPNSQGLLYEADEVRRCLQEGLTESPYMPLEESKVFAYIIEEIRRQIGA